MFILYKVVQNRLTKATHSEIDPCEKFIQFDKDYFGCLTIK